MKHRPRIDRRTWMTGLLCGALGGACSGDSAPTEFLAAPAATTGDFSRPSDAVPTSDGTTFFFTAKAGGDSEASGIYRVAAAGGSVTAVATGAPLVSPFGIAISRDDQTLYVSDPGSEGPNLETGQLFSVAASGGTPASVAGTLGSRPRSLYVQAGSDGKPDELYFTGVDPADGQPGLFKVPAAGGTLTVIAKGAPFHDPSGVAVTKDGDAYVVDTSGNDGGSAQVLHVHGGSATQLVGGLGVGYPAGVALPLDESSVLVSGIDPVTGFAIVYSINVTSGEIATFNKGIEGSVNSAGLHRAREKNVFSWADSTAGAASGGIVFRVELK